MIHFNVKLTRYSKHSFLLAALILSSFLGSCASGSGGEAREKRPNIIFLLTDDQRADALGIMGNPILKTPNLDRLGREGILFTNAYVTTSICMVSRASILSGQYMARHGIEDFQTSFSEEAFSLTYPALLRESGYTTGFVGKFGVGAPKDQPQEHFDFWEGSDQGQPDYEMTDEKGNYIHHTDKIGLDVGRFLTNYGDKEPFCLSVSFKAPHVQDNDPRQFIINPRYKDYYKDDTIPMPITADPKYWESFPDFFQTEENIARERWNLRFKTPEMYQESVKNYYRLLTDVDDMVGRMLEKLEEIGQADNTVIVFMGDNGFYLGEHGLAGKWYGHEESIRVPLIVYDPRKENKNRGLVSEEIALNIDIAPTILKLADQEIPGDMQGVDLMELVKGTDPGLSRKDFYYEHTYLGTPKIPKVEGVVSLHRKYLIFTENSYEEMYDLEADPLETINLALMPENQNQLEKMRDRYMELKLKAGNE